MRRPPEVCPSCGASVPRHARACPGCGADEQTGWSDEARGQELGLPDEEFDYESFVAEEFSERKRPGRPPIGWLWWSVAVVLLLAGLIGCVVHLAGSLRR